MRLSIFGIRHHGCGSARSVRAELARLRPDVVLIEGAPEANEIIGLANDAEMQPPTAILIYAPDDAKRAVYYPFAEFSPEWQAIQHALENKIPTRFIDLPQANQLLENVVEQSEIQNLKSKIRRDPLQFAAEAAGFADGEIWWESLVETRRGDEDLFGGILELMTALRETAANEIDEDSRRDDLREAFMRQEIRRAVKENYRNIAVVCGAWHAPVLGENSLQEFAKSDVAALKNLPKTKLAATWIPYTYSRLSLQSGYGAGVSSPEFYHQIWHNPENVAARWLARVANLLREQDLDASSASVIEAVRLAESLAVMRELNGVGLRELLDAVRAVLTFGDDAQLRLIQQKLIVGERLGQVPSTAPVVPLQRDLQRAQKSLRLKPEAAQKTLELDLRQDNDLQRSQLLHRLNLLDIDWGRITTTSGKGTFKEAWRVEWQPELSIKIIEANVWGNTIATAATNKVCDLAEKREKLADLTNLVGQTLLAELPDAIDFLMRQVAMRAAVSSDAPTMMDALPPLAEVLRYGNVRRTDLTAVDVVVDGLITRIGINLINAVTALDETAAAAMFDRVAAVDNAVKLLQRNDYAEIWDDALRRIADSENAHDLIAGRATRLLFDREKLTPDEIERRISLALSAAREPLQIAAWLEGFLRGGALILLHNPILLQTLDKWVTTLKSETFEQILPLLRRTFATFHKPERRKIGEQIKTGFASVNAKNPTRADENAEIEVERANQVLPLIAQLFQLSVISNHLSKFDD